MPIPQQRPRTSVITGARSGIGRATAELLRSRGETVLGIDLSGCEIDADLSNADGRNRALAEVQKHCPDRIDSLILCAGLSSSDGAAVVSVNYFGTVAIAEGLRPQLAQGHKPRAVIVSSSATILPTDDSIVALCLAGDEAKAREAATSASRDQAVSRQGLIYSASKVAVSRWIRRTALLPEWAGDGILLNGVSPGLVRTPMTIPLLASEEGRALLAKAVPRAVAEPAEPEDIALLLAFLAGADNRYLVGQVLYCDGGTDVLMRGDATY
jgi:NAD(P)-dependent dehydrogenase (short-subunit alcohol dehydrogenase family)